MENISTWRQQMRFLWSTATAFVITRFRKVIWRKLNETWEERYRSYPTYPSNNTYVPIAFFAKRFLPDLFSILIFEEIRRRKNPEPSLAKDVTRPTASKGRKERSRSFSLFLPFFRFFFSFVFLSLLFIFIFLFPFFLQTILRAHKFMTLFYERDDR